jgi:hypothetical protein
MFGKKPHVSPLESRKRLLIAESELNRAQLAQEWGAMTVSVRTLTGRVKSFGPIASAAVLLVAGLAACRRTKSTPAVEKLSWWQIFLKGAGMISTLWLAFHSRGHDQTDK